MKKVKVYIDGACEPINPGGTVSYGVVVFVDDKEIWRTSQILEAKEGIQTSNNVAEYLALARAIEFLIEEKIEGDITIYGDSQLVIKQMWGSWKIGSGIYAPYAKMAQQLLALHPEIKGEWIPREENELADELSKAELVKAGIKIRERYR